MHNDTRLLEMLILEGAQAGLSWTTILRKREGYREAFQGFDIPTVATFTDADYNRLLLNPRIVRNRAKIRAAILAAQVALTIQAEHGSLDNLLWSFVGGIPVQNAWKSMDQIPAKTAVSDAMSKALVAKGMKFVGSTICYAFMQATGMVNDHIVTCPQYKSVRAVSA